MKWLLLAWLSLLPALAAAQARRQVPFRPWDQALGGEALAALMRLEVGEDLQWYMDDFADSRVRLAAERGEAIARPDPTDALDLLAHDFDGDGRPEIPVRFPPAYCGTAGCDYALMVQHRPGAWQQVCGGKVHEISLLQSRVAGWQEFTDADGVNSWYREYPGAPPKCFTRQRFHSYYEFHGDCYAMTLAELRRIGWRDRHGRWTRLARQHGVGSERNSSQTYAAQEAAFTALLRSPEDEVRRAGLLRHAGRVVTGLAPENHEMPLTTMGLVLAARAVGVPTLAAYVADRVARDKSPPRPEPPRSHPMRRRWLQAEAEIARFDHWPYIVRPVTRP